LRREFLAVSGEVTRVVAGFGLFAWLGRTVWRARRRATAVLPATVPVAAVVLTAAIALLPNDGGAARVMEHGPTPTTGVPVVERSPAAPPPAPVTTVRPPAAEDTPAAPVVAVTGSGDAAPTAVAGPAQLFLGSSAPRQRAEALPVTTVAGPITAGVDLPAAVTDTVDGITSRLTDLDTLDGGTTP
jgi:hypothetical protein